MTHFDYLIIGGGQVADDAARAIRERDAEGTIGILSADSDAPYTRPALSKKLWTDPDFDESRVPLATAEDTGAQLRLETLVTSIDRAGRSVLTSAGERIEYGALLLATGSVPRELAGPDDERIIAFRSFADYRQLRDLAQELPADAPFVVVGGGYIGNEIAAALVGNGVRTVLVHPGELLLGDKFPAALARRYESLFTEAGVELVNGARAERIERAEDGLSVVLEDGRRVPAAVVVVGLGAEPALDLAREAGLEVADGVIVDERLRTSDPAIWAAGDIAEYPDPLLGRTRIEHVDNARETGAAAGASMSGSDSPYRHTPYFYSQVFGSRWEAVGELDSSCDAVEERLGEDQLVVYYLDDQQRPVGVLLWNIEDARDAARDVLRDRPQGAEALRGRIS